jgi:hypothetical protein
VLLQMVMDRFGVFEALAIEQQTRA